MDCTKSDMDLLRARVCVAGALELLHRVLPPWDPAVHKYDTWTCTFLHRLDTCLSTDTPLWPRGKIGKPVAIRQMNLLQSCDRAMRGAFDQPRIDEHLTDEPSVSADAAIAAAGGTVRAWIAFGQRGSNPGAMIARIGQARPTANTIAALCALEGIPTAAFEIYATSCGDGYSPEAAAERATALGQHPNPRPPASHDEAFRIAGVGHAPMPRPLIQAPPPPNPDWGEDRVRDVAWHCASLALTRLGAATDSSAIAAALAHTDALQRLSQPGALHDVATVNATTGGPWARAIRLQQGTHDPLGALGTEETKMLLFVVCDAVAAGHHADRRSMRLANDALRAAVTALTKLHLADATTRDAHVALTLAPYGR